MARQLLCIAYHFPPVGGAGVQRTVKFIRYLPEFGWSSAVVAGPVGSTGDTQNDVKWASAGPGIVFKGGLKYHFGGT